MRPTVIITGCGYKPIKHIYRYKGRPSHNSIPIKGKDYKMNIGTATAFYLVKKGVKVIMISRTEEKLKQIKKGLVRLGCNDKLINYIATDVMTDKGINYLIKKLPKNKIFYWVQSVGIGGGSYKIPNDNIYLPFEKISPEIIKAELEISIATHRMMLKMIKIFRKQIKNKQKAKICVITSMSGERGYHFGTTHVAAKHALVGWIKGIKRELEDEGIEIYDIRPGAIDTGMYDNPYVSNAIRELSKRGDNYKGNNNEPLYEPPLSVAKKVYLALFGKNPKKVYRILAPYQE